MTKWIINVSYLYVSFSVDIPFTALGSLYKDLCEKYEPPTFALEEGYASHSCEEEGKAHNAGYDAFMTGVCFVTMVKKLGKEWQCYFNFSFAWL